MLDDQVIRDDYLSLSKQDKEVWLLEQCQLLLRYQYQYCKEYRQFINNQYPDLLLNQDSPDSASGWLKNIEAQYKSLASLPFLAARVFKNKALYTEGGSEVAHVMSSSGTSNQGVSQIYLDADNAILQKKVLTNLLKQHLGNRRLPMLICDQAPQVGAAMKASQAASLGFSLFASQRYFAYGPDSKMDTPDNTLDFEAIKKWASQSSPLLMFGFTSQAWTLLNELNASATKAELEPLLNNKEIMFFHGGGWKKMQAQAVSKADYKQGFKKVFGSKIQVKDYYGMIEQTGNIYVECDAGYFHSTDISHIIIRDPVDFSVKPIGQQGLIQTISLTAQSYPGFSLLTEDLGTLFGEDCCSCGHKGQFFSVDGRKASAEVRGCSDTAGAQV
jgi:phenylacetate-coenzyme A ligase PaaK-like adenylate-forming protein